VTSDEVIKFWSKISRDISRDARKIQ